MRSSRVTRQRVWHVHFKDCHPQIAADARANELGYLAAVRSKLFCELGAGAVDFAAVLAALHAASITTDGSSSSRTSFRDRGRRRRAPGATAMFLEALGA